MRLRQAAVVGLGNFGFSVARTLAEKGCHVLCVDADMEKVQAIKDSVLNAVQADATDERALRAIGMPEVDVAIISLGDNREASILAAMILQDLGVKEIVVKVVSDLHARVLKRLGVSQVVFPEKDMGRRVAERLLAPQILEHLELSEEYGIEEIVSPKDFLGKTIADLKFRTRYGVSILAIRRRTANGREHKEMVVNPTRDDRILPGDLLIVIGHEKDLAKLRE
jgi:trk system potassium uptake protein TrkA